MRKIIEIDLGKYKSIELTIDEAEKLLKEIASAIGGESQDLEETYRVLRNYEAFYELAKKKYKDYIVPSKSLNDMIRGTVIVDRVKLIKEGDIKKVVITFDRRIKEEIIAEALRKLGYTVEIVRLSK